MSHNEKITSFFKFVTPVVHKLNILIEQQKLSVRLEESKAEALINQELRCQQSLADNIRRKAEKERMRVSPRT